MVRRFASTARAIALALALALASLGAPTTLAEDCNCTVHGTVDVEVQNFPTRQQVVLVDSSAVVTVRETDLTRLETREVNLGAGEKIAWGPFPLEGRSRLTIQASLVQPRTLLSQPPLTVKWYVRFHKDDAYFDPCSMMPVAECRIGFPGPGASLKMASPATLAPLIDSVPITTGGVSIASTELEGVEGLLVLDNTGNGVRTVRVQAVFNR